jgi:hypothetical protein
MYNSSYQSKALLQDILASDLGLVRTHTTTTVVVMSYVAMSCQVWPPKYTTAYRRPTITPQLPRCPSGHSEPNPMVQLRPRPKEKEESACLPDCPPCYLVGEVSDYIHMTVLTMWPVVLFPVMQFHAPSGHLMTDPLCACEGPCRSLVQMGAMSIYSSLFQVCYPAHLPSWPPLPAAL